MAVLGDLPALALGPGLERFLLGRPSVWHNHLKYFCGSFRSTIAGAFLLPSTLFLSGCDGLQKGAKAGDGTAIVHDGSRVTVPTGNPLSSWLQVQAAELTTVQ